MDDRTISSCSAITTRRPCLSSFGPQVRSYCQRTLAPTACTNKRIGFPLTAAYPLTRSIFCSSAIRLILSARSSGFSSSGKSTTILSKSSWSWSWGPSWWDGLASMSSSAAASKPKTTRGSTLPSTTSIKGRVRGPVDLMKFFAFFYIIISSQITFGEQD